MATNEVDTILKTIQDMPDESLALILPNAEAEFKNMINNKELLNKIKTEYLERGYTKGDVEEVRDSFIKIGDDYLKLVSPTSPKGRYITALIGVYQDFYNAVIEEGFSRTVNVEVEKISEDAILPTYAHNSDAGCDAYAAEDVTVASGETKIIPTGLKFAIPDGYEVQVRPRSGMSVKTQTKVTLGTIDSEYRGPVGIMLTNYGPEPYEVKKGDRIAQFIIAPVYHMNFLTRESLNETERGDGGFGSSGV